MGKFFQQQGKHDYVPEVETPFKRGIDHQREIYKQANLESNYDLMVKTLENIKMEIKQQAVAKGNNKQIIRIEKILHWYKMIPLNNTKQTEEGRRLVIPADMEIRINHNLNVAYEITLEQLSILRLLT